MNEASPAGWSQLKQDDTDVVSFRGLLILNVGGLLKILFLSFGICDYSYGGVGC